MMIALTALMIGLLVIGYWANDSDILCPTVFYLSGFSICALVATLCALKWDLELQGNTFFVLFGGGLLFAVSSLVVHTVYRRYGLAACRSKKVSPDASKPLYSLPVCTPAIALFACVQIVVILWTAVRLQSLLPGVDIFQAISGYRLSRTFDAEKLTLGFPLDPMRNFCYAAGFLIVALAAQELSKKRLRHNPLIVISLLLAIVLDLESGSRTDSVCYLFVLGLLFLLFKRKQKQVGGLLSVGSITLLLVLVILFAISFQSFAIGRSVNRGILEYLSVYCGSEIANLNDYLQTYNSSASDVDVWGGMTFVRLITYIGEKLGIEAWVYSLDLPYNFMNGYNLGNVYTTYYSFIYDFGYFGVVPCVIAMAVLSQVFYEKAKAGNSRYSEIWAILYGYMAYRLLLCFFSNKFYEGVASPTFLRLCLYIFISRYIYIAISGRLDSGRKKPNNKKNHSLSQRKGSVPYCVMHIQGEICWSRASQRHFRYSFRNGERKTAGVFSDFALCGSLDRAGVHPVGSNCQ